MMIEDARSANEQAEATKPRPICSRWLPKFPVVILVCLAGIAIPMAHAQFDWTNRHQPNRLGEPLDREDVGSFMGSLYYQECILNQIAGACTALIEGTSSAGIVSPRARANALSKRGEMREARRDYCAALSDYQQSLHIQPSPRLRARAERLVMRVDSSCRARVAEESVAQSSTLLFAAAGNRTTANAGWTTYIRTAILPRRVPARAADLPGLTPEVIDLEMIVARDVPEPSEPAGDAAPPAEIALEPGSENAGPPILQSASVSAATDGGVSTSTLLTACAPSAAPPPPECGGLVTGSIPGLTTASRPADPGTANSLPIAVLIIALVLSSSLGLVAVLGGRAPVRGRWSGLFRAGRRSGQDGDAVAGRSHRDPFDESAVTVQRVGIIKDFAPPVAAHGHDHADEQRIEPAFEAVLEPSQTILEPVVQEPEPSLEVWGDPDAIAAPLADPECAGALTDALQTAASDIDLPQDAGEEAMAAAGTEEPAEVLSEKVSLLKLIVQGSLASLEKGAISIFVLDGDGYLSQQVRSNWDQFSHGTRGVRSQLVEPEAHGATGLLNLFRADVSDPDPLIARQRFNVVFDLHAQVFEPLFGRAFVNSNRVALRHFVRLLHAMPGANFRMWQNLLASENLSSLAQYAAMTGNAETERYFEQAIKDDRFVLFAADLERRLAAHLEDQAFSRLTSSAHFETPFERHNVDGRLMVFTPEILALGQAKCIALSRIYLALAVLTRPDRTAAAEGRMSSLISIDAEKLAGDWSGEFSGLLQDLTRKSMAFVRI